MGKAMEQLNLATWPSCMASRPDKWASHAQSSVKAATIGIHTLADYSVWLKDRQQAF
jgi:hypothetical protein